jgi:hypothetical protein
MRTIVQSLACQLVFIAVASALSSAAPSNAQIVPSQNSYAAFVSDVAALAAPADDLVANERTAARQVYFRQKVTNKVLAAFPSNDLNGLKLFKLDDVLDPKTLLCDFRWRKQWTIVKTISTRDSNASITLDQLATAKNQSYSNKAVKDLNATAAPANTGDPILAFKVLFGSPPSAEIDPSKKPSIDDETRKYIQTSCERDLGEFEAAYYGEPIPVVVSGPQGAAPAVATPPEAATPAIPDLSFLGPSGAALTTAVNIISSVIESFAAMRADSEAAAKVSELLKASEAPLTQGGHDLARTGSDFLFAKRSDTSTALNNHEKLTAPRSYQNMLQTTLKTTDSFWQEVTKLATFAGAIATTASSANAKRLEQSFGVPKP